MYLPHSYQANDYNVSYPFCGGGEGLLECQESFRWASQGHIFAWLGHEELMCPPASWFDPGETCEMLFARAQGYWSRMLKDTYKDPRLLELSSNPSSSPRPVTTTKRPLGIR